jgi:hydroxymethylbilane synthase
MLDSLVFGTRGSALARWQTEWVVAQLNTHWPGLTCQIKTFSTSGDRNLNQPLAAIGGKGLFTAELENALHTHEIDVAVHSLKDLPVEDTEGLTLGAICERADARDVLIARNRWTFATLPTHARLGTCSLRRTAQALALRPDLVVLPVRGNVDTRIRKVLNGEYDAIILAAAGVQRLSLNDHITDYFSFEQMLPAPGQAALAVQCRVADKATRELLQKIEHAPTRSAVTAERTFLLALSGGCSAPVAAYASLLPSPIDGTVEDRAGGEGQLQLIGLIASPDGQRVLRLNAKGSDPTALGQRLAGQAFAQGARELLA